MIFPLTRASFLQFASRSSDLSFQLIEIRNHRLHRHHHPAPPLTAIGRNATPFVMPWRGSSWRRAYAGGEGKGAWVRRSAGPEMAKLAASPPADSKTGSVTKAAFAERVGLTRGRISQLIAQGLPVLADGRIEVEAGLRWMEETLDPDRR